MFARLRETAAIQFNHHGGKNTYPFMLAIGWRDDLGFNPGIIGWVQHPEGLKAFVRFARGRYRKAD